MLVLQKLLILFQAQFAVYTKTDASRKETLPYLCVPLLSRSQQLGEKFLFFKTSSKFHLRQRADDKNVKSGTSLRHMEDEYSKTTRKRRRTIKMTKAFNAHSFELQKRVLQISQ